MYLIWSLYRHGHFFIEYCFLGTGHYEINIHLFIIFVSRFFLVTTPKALTLVRF